MIVACQRFTIESDHRESVGRVRRWYGRLDENRMMASINDDAEVYDIQRLGRAEDRTGCVDATQVRFVKDWVVVLAEDEEQTIAGPFVTNQEAIDWCNDNPLELAFKWDVCPTCDGKGTYVNPSIDAHGLTSDDFAEDPDFAEDYFRGTYDVTCAECCGRRVVPFPVDEMHHAYQAAVSMITEDYVYQADCAAERRMGA